MVRSPSPLKGWFFCTHLPQGCFHIAILGKGVGREQVDHAVGPFMCECGSRFERRLQTWAPVGELCLDGILHRTLDDFGRRPQLVIKAPQPHPYNGVLGMKGVIVPHHSGIDELEVCPLGLPFRERLVGSHVEVVENAGAPSRRYKAE